MKLPRAKKKFGQHFLRDQKVIQKICADFKGEAKALIEVGPGPGILTGPLSALALPFAVCEVDADFIPGLHEWVAEKHIHHGDALEVNWEDFIAQHELPGPVWLVSNLPYNVGSPLLVKFLASPSIAYMTLMFQREVALKALGADEKRRPDMSSLAALAQTYCQVKELVKVPRGAFAPPPKVESLVLSFSRRQDSAIALSEFFAFERFLRALFREKRKQLGHVLKKMLGNEALEQYDQKLRDLSICKKDRAQDLTLLQVQGLYKTLASSLP